MKQRKSRFDAALDSCSDFAVDSWLWALRFSAILAVMLVVATTTGSMDGNAWIELPARWQEMFLLVFGTGILLALAYRVDRALARQRMVRQAPMNGGRRPSKRALKRERARQKRRNRS